MNHILDRKLRFRFGLAFAAAVAGLVMTASCKRVTPADSDLQRCVRNGGPFRMSPPLVAYRTNGGVVEQARIPQTDGITRVSPFVLGEAKPADGPPDLLVVQGLDLSAGTGTLLVKNIVDGAAPSKSTDILIGTGLAHRAKLRVGSVIRFEEPIHEQNQIGVTVAGIFQTGVAGPDEDSIYMSVAGAMALFGIPNPTGLAIDIASLDSAAGLRNIVEDALGPGHRVRDWRELNRNTLDSLLSIGFKDTELSTLDGQLPILCSALGPASR